MKAAKKKYAGYLIDADNTIFDYNRCEREAFTETFSSRSNRHPLDKIYRKFQYINQLVWKDFEDNKIRADEINITRFTILAKELDIKEDITDLASKYLETLAQKSHLIPGSIQVLEKLSRRASLSLITNGLSYVQRNRLVLSGIEVFFHSIIISEEIGASKPNKSFFEKAISSLYLPPHDILCVGDSPKSDIRGGHFAGLDTCWYMRENIPYPVEHPIPDYIITDFKELLEFAPMHS